MKTQMRAAATCLLTLTAACTPSLAALSAPQIGCPESAITVQGSDDAWQATCGDQVYQCVKATAPNSAAQASLLRNVSGKKSDPDLDALAFGQAVNPSVAVACTPVGGSTTKISAPPPPPSGPSTVSRQQEGDNTTLRLSLSEPPFALGFEWSSATSAVVRSSWIVPVKQGGATREACAVSLVVDAETMPMPPPKYQAVPAREVFRFELPVAVLEKLSAAKSALARVCDEQLVFSPASRAALGELLAGVRGSPPAR